MTEMHERAGLQVDADLVRFIEQDVLPGLGRNAGPFWAGLAGILARFTPENRALLGERDRMQAEIDAWHRARRGQKIEWTEYRALLERIGYLVPEPSGVRVGSANVDEEVAKLAGPQLVVPVLNARFLLNAVNARWGSLYDALSGTDAEPG